MQMMNMIPESVRIADRSVTRRKCDQPGVVIEKESLRGEEEIKIIYMVHHLFSSICYRLNPPTI